jgi:5-methylcytosine-specific restriction endonuclease McrA
VAREVNKKCFDCAQVKDFRDAPKPDCYERQKCVRKRGYYARHERNKWWQVQNHRYLRYRGDKCAICRDDDSLEVHHVIPQCKGGLDARFNLLTLCKKCHRTISTYYRVIGWQ